MGWLGTFLICAIGGMTAWGGQSVTLAWDPSADTNVVGYALYYGTSSGTYPNRVDVGSVTNATVSGLQEGVVYYFVATAYDAASLESLPSNEVSYSVPVSVNQPPTLDTIASLTLGEDAGLQTVNLSGISSGATNESQTLTVTATSDNATLISNPTVSYISPSASGTLTFTPVANAAGTSIITVTVNDSGASNNIVTRTFSVTVNAVNDAPTISGMANQTINAGGTTGPIPFTVGDVESAVGSLTVSGDSSNPGLVPANSIIFGGSGSSRTVMVTPAAGQTGSATITVTVSDGQLSSSTSFTLTVTAAIALRCAQITGTPLAMLAFQGQAGETVSLQASDDLATWTTLYELHPTANQTIQIVDPASATLPQRFYRLMGDNVSARTVQLSRLPAARLAQVSFLDPSGALVNFQASEDLQNWTTLHQLRSATDQWIEIVDPASAQLPRRFYRIAPAN